MIRNPAAAAEDLLASILRVRRARVETLGGGLFADTPWDILLHLYAARLAGRTSKLTDFAAVAPQSTLARWIQILEERRLITCHLNRLHPPDLGIELSVEGETKMASLFQRFRHLQPVA